MIKAIVAGAAGRMGSRIIGMIAQNPDLVLSGAIENPGHPNIGMDAGHAAGLGDTGIPISGSLKEVIDRGDVLIDFTRPEATMENIRLASSRGISMVIGTTGITGDDLNELVGLARSIRCVMAPNMSVGMNVMFRIVGELARLLEKDFDIEILEAHHRLKKDAPSGTALRLAQIISESVRRDLKEVAVYGRKGLIGERNDKEIGIQVLRGGDITGDHTVMFAGIGERLELTHRAHNRDNLARGALKAAVWVVNQPRGLYDMQDVLGLK